MDILVKANLDCNHEFQGIVNNDSTIVVLPEELKCKRKEVFSTSVDLIYIIRIEVSGKYKLNDDMVVREVKDQILYWVTDNPLCIESMTRFLVDGRGFKSITNLHYKVLNDIQHNAVYIGINK